MYPSLPLGLKEALTTKVIKILNHLEQSGCRMHFFSYRNDWQVFVLHPDNTVNITDLVALARDSQIESDFITDAEITAQPSPSPEPLALYPARTDLSFFTKTSYPSQYPLKTDADPTFLEWLAEKESSETKFHI